MPIILFIAFVFAAALYIVQPLADPDLWWHIVTGRWILANQTLPTKDIWTQFGGDVHWVAYSWSNEIIFALFDRWFGLEGLLFLQMFLAVIFTVVLCYTLGKVAKNYILGSLLGAAIVAGCHAHFALRPQSVIWVYLTLILFISEQISQYGLNRRRIIFLMIVFCAWANAHITTIIGLGVVAAWTSTDFPLKLKDLRIPIIACIFGLLATFITPYLGYEWIIFFSKSGHPLTFSSIQEFAPANIMQTPTAFLLLSAALVAAFWFLNRKAVTAFQLIGAAALLVGSLAVIKFLPFALIFIGFILARQWRYLGSEDSYNPGLIQALQRLEALIRKIPKEGLSFVLICTALVNASNTWGVLIDKNETPVEAVDLMQSKNLPLPLMNSFGQGGYLSYRYADLMGNPGLKVSIDGRTNLISHDVWEQYQKSWLGNWGWRAYIERVNPKTILWRGDSALIRILEAEGKWCTVFNKGARPNSNVVMLKRDTVESLVKEGSDLRCLDQ